MLCQFGSKRDHWYNGINVYRWADRFRLSQGEQRCDGSSFGKKRDAETLRNESEGFMKQSCSAVLIDGLYFLYILDVR